MVQALSPDHRSCLRVNKHNIVRFYAQRRTVHRFHSAFGSSTALVTAGARTQAAPGAGALYLLEILHELYITPLYTGPPGTTMSTNADLQQALGPYHGTWIKVSATQIAIMHDAANGAHGFLILQITSRQMSTHQDVHNRKVALPFAHCVHMIHVM